MTIVLNCILHLQLIIGYDNIYISVYFSGIKLYWLTNCTFSLGIPKKPSVGDIVAGQVRKVMPNECLLVSFGAGLLGRVDITDISDDYSDHPLSKSQTHSIVKYVTASNWLELYSVNSRVKPV